MWLSVLGGELTIGEGSKAYQNHRARAAIRSDLRNFKGVMFARGSQVSDIKLLSATVGMVFVCEPSLMYTTMLCVLAHFIFVLSSYC